MFVVCGSAGALKAPGALLGIKGSLSVAAISQDINPTPSSDDAGGALHY